MQHDFCVCALDGCSRQRIKYVAAKPGPSHDALDSHAPDFCAARRGCQQAASGQHLPQTVAGHGMNRTCIVAVVFQLEGHALLTYKNLNAKGSCTLTQIAPGAHGNTAHALACLVACEKFTQKDWYGLRGLGVRICKDINETAADQQLITAKSSRRKLDRRAANPHAFQAYAELVVKPGRACVFQARFFDIQVAAQHVHRLFIRQSKSPPVFGNGSVKIHQVVGVEDNFLHVYFYPANPQWVKKSKIIFCHIWLPSGRR